MLTTPLGAEQEEKTAVEVPSDSIEPIPFAPHIYAIRTTANKEKAVAEKLAEKVERDKYNISAILVTGLRGYILVEGDREAIEQAYKGVAHARGVVNGETSISEIDHFLAPNPAAKKLSEDFIVEVTSGPFKGEKAKIVRVLESKNEIIIELLEASVPIPLTVSSESVRVLQRDEKKEEEKKEEESEK